MENSDKIKNCSGPELRGFPYPSSTVYRVRDLRGNNCRRLLTNRSTFDSTVRTKCAQNENWRSGAEVPTPVSAPFRISLLIIMCTYPFAFYIHV